MGRGNILRRDLRPLLADGAARARAAGVAHDLRGDGLMSRRRITWRQSMRASETAPASVWQPSFTLLKNSLDVLWFRVIKRRLSTPS